METRNASLRAQAQHDAKISIFSVCVGVLKKNTDTEVARKRKNKKFLLSATPPNPTELFTKRLCFLRLPREVARFGA